VGRKPLLAREEVLEAIQRSIVTRGVPPTIEELREGLRLGSTRTVLRYLRWLEEDGAIERWSGARGIRLRKMSGGDVETRAVPLVGEAPAGPLMVAEQNVEGWVRLPREFARPAEAKFFLLRVRGDSMNKAVVEGGRIENGDLVIVRQQAMAEPGHIVVALIDGEATIKRLQKTAAYWVLKPESTNPNHKPILVGPDFQIQGIVRAVLKNGSTIVAGREAEQ
jgi:repressor LexA